MQSPNQQPLDFAKSANEAVEASKYLSDAIANHRVEMAKKFNPARYDIKLFEIVFEADLLLNERVFRLLYENKVPVDIMNRGNLRVVYFATKEEAKLVRDAINNELKTDIIRVSYGPDHRRNYGHVA